MKRAIKFCFLISVTLFLFSCSIRVQESYFVEKLDSADVLIAQGLNSDANKILSKLEKKSHSPVHSLSLAKRYIIMEEYGRAAKFLAKSVKINPDEEQLKAVYVWTLLKDGKTREAYEKSQDFKNSDYAGLYAEASFKEFNDDELDVEDYLEQDLQKEYLMAFRVSNNIQFLQDAAVYECYHGNLQKAYSYHPIRIPDNESAEFWTLVCYDSKNYVQAIKDAENVSEQDAGRKARVCVISADSYLRMNELANAQSMWEMAFNLDSSVDPNILMNYAYSFIEEGETEKAFVAVKKAANMYPDFYPALSLYTKFAINDSVTDSESSLSRELRKLGLKSRDMILRDSRERIQISDAQYRMQKSYEKTGDPQLQIELMKLKWVNAKNLSKDEMCVDVWNLLEHNYTNEENGDPAILDYAIEFFIQQGKYDEACSLLETRLQKEYGTTDCMQILEKLSYAECRLFAAVKFRQNDGSSCEALLNQSLKCNKSINDDVYINLANFSETKGDYKTARDYYSRIISKTLNVYTKAEMCYRLAMLSFNEGDNKNALSYIDYCLRLNPTHTEARLLQKKIRA